MPRPRKPGHKPAHRPAHRPPQNPAHKPQSALADVLSRIPDTGPDLREPPCRYWAACGNCQVMQLTSPAQLRLKGEFVTEAFRIHGSMRVVPAPAVAAPSESGYRRRATVRAAFGPGGLRLGLLKYGTRELVDLPNCMILHPQLSLALEAVRSACAAYLEGLSGEFELDAVCDAGTRVGLEFTAAESLIEPLAEMAQALVEAGIEVVRLSDDRGGTVLELGDPRLFVLRPDPSDGAPSDPAPAEVRFSLGSFTQMNFEQNAALVSHVEAAAREIGAARILDLYAGIGNLGLAMAPHASEVVAVESSMSSVADARDNAARLGLTNVRIVRGPSSNAMRELLHRRERFDLVVLNPTRAGADGVVEPLCKLAARRICYVSCAPTTLARDVAVLVRGGYALTSVTPFDMFPQTYHVETIAVLDLKKKRGPGRAPSG